MPKRIQSIYGHGGLKHILPLIIPTGLLTLRMPFRTKYGIMPWSLFKVEKYSEEESDAMKCWKIVDARL